ncbi:MAG: hypothetical protein IJZ32_01080 [Clostridia bacterium]|nr:hypothetical protein [Clostridia bacterium]
MKTKKLMALLLSASTLGACVAGAAGCGGNKASGVVSDGKTVNVAVVSGGYGTTWLNKLAEKFEAVYAAEGYKINVLTPRNNLKNDTALSEMRLGSKTGVDLYLTAGVYLDAALDEDYGVCVENLNDVYNNGAINFDGSVEETPIKDKTSADQHYLLKEGDDWYKFHYYTAPLGLVANVKVLADYGITELPRTTNELFEMYDAIYYGANGKEGTKKTNVYPTVWAGENAYGYPYNPFLDHYAQLMGNERFENDFFNLNSVLELEDMSKGYELFCNDYLKECIEVFVHQNDVMYSVLGSASQKHDQAHAQLIRGNAAFMSDGAYFFNEVRANFSTRLNDIRFCQTPMISYLGVDLKLDGSGADEAKCDDILSYMTKLVDEGKTNAEIETMTETQFSGVDITAEQVARVVDARNVNGTSYQADGYITKGSPMADVAELFLRMMASEDAAELWSEYGLMSAYDQSDKTEYDYAFLKDVADIHNTTTKKIFYSSTYGLRKEMGTTVGFGDFSASMVTSITADIGVVEDPRDRDYAALATTLCEKNLTKIQTVWPTWLETAQNYINGVKNNG